jgi:hypothetical protein
LFSSADALIRAEAEVERLREALERIARGDDYPEYAMDIAEAALAGGEGEK